MKGLIPGYFQGINQIIPEQYRFEKRTRQPGADYFNVVLNYLYGLTYGQVTRALQAAGLDTYTGALHKTALRETLVYDFIEVFRPEVDCLLIQMCHDHLWQPEHFSPVDGGFLLNNKGKRLLFPQYCDHLRQRIKWKNQVMSLENHIFHEARRLKQQIENTEADVSDILRY